MSAQDIYVGTASWNIPKEHKTSFPVGASQLQSYAQILNCVEINSSFYKHHQAKTYERWAATVPEDFRFSVKLAKEFTHEKRLDVEKDEMNPILQDILRLGNKLGVILIQIAPSLGFDTHVADGFFSALREIVPELPIVFEPRHLSWVTPPALRMLKKYAVSKVMADPEPCAPPESSDIEVAGGLAYLRLHGSPEIYRSLYDKKFMKKIEEQIRGLASARPVWCLFDNTTFGHATTNAFELMQTVSNPS